VNRRDLIRQISLAALPVAAQSVPAAETKPRLKTSICAYSYREQLQSGSMKYDDVIRLAADLGVDGAELTTYWFPDTSDSFLFPLRRFAYRQAVDIHGIGIRTNMCRPTPELQAAEAANVQQWITVAEKLGARYVRVFGGRVPKDATEDQAVGWAVETLRRCAGIAAERGMILGIEDDGGITLTAARVVEMVRKVDSPWLGINLDVGNFRDNAYRQIEICLPYAVNVHFKPEVMEGGKRQPADWERLVRMFAPVYRGYLSLEYEHTENALTAVPPLIAKLQHILRSPA